MSRLPHNQQTDTHTSNRRELELFLLKLMLFALPLLLAAVPSCTILAWTGEAFRDLEPTLQHSIKFNRGLIGYAWNEQNYPWMKRQALLLMPPQDVLAIGSSRVLQFRREMFVRPFWNAGYTILTTADFQTFLSLIPTDRHPKTLLIALDQWMFNSAWIAESGNTSPERWTQNPSYNLRTGLRLLPDVCTDLARGRIGLMPLLQQRPDNPWGLNAWQNAKGFRPDGSFAYGRQIQQRLANDPQTPDFQFAGTLRRIASGSDRFQFGKTPDIAALNSLQSFLQNCSELKIHVIAVLPPFADPVSRALQKSGRHQYLDQLPAALQQIFSGTSHELHCLPSLASLGADDTEAVDGFHSGEKATLRQLLHMLQQGSRLNKCCNSEQLGRDLAAAPNPLEVYPR
ncbi:MAG: hypothetical protein ACKPJJ_03985 [Planctomycetaceae bacterium]